MGLGGSGRFGILLFGFFSLEFRMGLGGSGFSFLGFFPAIPIFWRRFSWPAPEGAAEGRIGDRGRVWDFPAGKSSGKERPGRDPRGDVPEN